MLFKKELRRTCGWPWLWCESSPYPLYQQKYWGTQSESYEDIYKWRTCKCANTSKRYNYVITCWWGYKRHPIPLITSTWQLIKFLLHSVLILCRTFWLLSQLLGMMGNALKIVTILFKFILPLFCLVHIQYYSKWLLHVLSNVARH